MAKFYLVAKYTFYVVVVFGAGLAIERLHRIKRWWEPKTTKADDLIYNVSSPMAIGNFDSIFSKHYLKCVTQPAKPFCLLTANRRLEIFRSEQGDSPNPEEVEKKFRNATSSLELSKRKIQSLLTAFTKIMQNHHVKVLLIEPSMLFCLLSMTKKREMLARGFNPGRLLGSRDVVTVGVLGKDSEKLETRNLTMEALSAGFKISKFRKSIGEETEKSFETVHYFFIMQGVAVHVVIFYPRKSYVWYSGLDPKESNFEGLLFVNDGIFHNFSLLPLDLSSTSISRMYVPYNVQYFMQQIESSKAVECRSNSSGIISTHIHPNLTKAQLQKRVEIVLKELEIIMAPETVFFWLWSKSLLGWYAECDVFHYSTTLDLAVTFESVKDLNFTAALDENEFLKISNDNKSDGELTYKLDCHGLLVNIFFLYKDNDVLWYKNKKQSSRITFPEFQLCSSQIFGEKILVPCNTDDILKFESEQSRRNDTDLNVSSEDSLTLSNEKGS